jgi:hypothetical protein
MNEDDSGVAPPSEQEAAAAKRRGRRRGEPLRVQIELVVVDGEAGKELGNRQAVAIRRALQWFADNPPAADWPFGPAR